MLIYWLNKLGKIRNTKIFSNQFLIFSFGLGLFVITAILGWLKLKYGLNFVDEGYHMTESWRLSVGDHFLKDKIADILLLYTLINAQLFKIFPNITLLGFREIQYAFALLSCSIVGLALFSVSKKYWYLPFILSVFAFTGLDACGVISNLNYYTYSHLFLILYISLVLLGLSSRSIVLRRCIFLASGFVIWLLSLVELQLSVLAVSPILIYAFLRYSKPEMNSFTFFDLCMMLAPFILCWLVFLGTYNEAYILSVIESVTFFIQNKWYLTKINWGIIASICISLAYITEIYVIAVKLKNYELLLSLIVITVLMYLVIDTSLFGFIKPYLRTFGKQMWLSSFLIASILFVWFQLGKRFFFRR